MQAPDTNFIYTETTGDKSNPCFIAGEERQDSVIYIPLKSFNPILPLNKPGHIAGSLIYTLVFLIIFAFLRIRSKGLFSLMLSVLIKRKKYELILNEGIPSNLGYYILALLLSFSILATGIAYFSFHAFYLKPIIYIFCFLILYHICTLCTVRLLAWTFNIRNVKEEVIVNIWTYNILIGLFISPLVLSLFFVKLFALPLLAKIITICLVMFYLVKLIRWFEILFTYRVSILYMILYLCALEVIPLLILYKYVAL
ncbi:DUF4271 domain-containing protein [Odoribacter laneus]|uniref:DUF4271 domain-containing protein n=1 Tax=Odoribacter laneus TaxID=626933 RepID=UPI000338482C|nr:DUF4271 domain-containing protein [Odoribacter laneus]CCZ81059.1 putative uncharacterized protein [Odoribacter laneus CAG:561]